VKRREIYNIGMPASDGLSGLGGRADPRLSLAGGFPCLILGFSVSSMGCCGGDDILKSE
jgi:hypothetical protein